MNTIAKLLWRRMLGTTSAAVILFCSTAAAQSSSARMDEFHVSTVTATVPDIDSAGYNEYSIKRHLAADADCKALQKLLLSGSINAKQGTRSVFDYFETYEWGTVYADHTTCYGKLEKYMPVRLEAAKMYGFAYYDKSVIVNPKYAWIYLFTDGLAGVMLNDKWGYIDINGEEAITPQFDKAELFHEGFAAVIINGRWGFIDRRGSWMVHPQYTWAFSFALGRAAVQSGGKWGYIDRAGKVVVPLDYESASYFNTDNKLAVVKRAGKYAYMNRSGELLTPFRYDSTRPPVYGLASVEVDKKYGYVDDMAREIIPAIYDYGTDFYGERACIRLNGKWGEVDGKGKVHWQLLNVPCVQ